jgi:hypothetical protein
MLAMPKVIEALEQARLRDCVKVFAGGAPVSEKFAVGTGVDAYAVTAPEGVEGVQAMANDCACGPPETRPGHHPNPTVLNLHKEMDCGIIGLGRKALSPSLL